MPSYRHHNLGNMYINFEIEFPDVTPSLNSEQKDTLKTILGLPVPTAEEKKARQPAQDPNGMNIDGDDPMELDPLTEPLPKGAAEEDVDLEDVDHQGARRAHGATMEDEDEDGVPHGAERVQCASQ